MMAKTLYILDSFTCPTGYNHMFMALKIARGFGYNGYEFKVVSKIEDITEPGFVLLNDQPFFYSFGFRRNPNGNVLRYIPDGIERLDRKIFGEAIKKRLSVWLQRPQLRKLADQIRDKNIILIEWNRHWDKEFLDGLKIPVIYIMDTGFGPPALPHRKIWYDFCKANKNAFPLKFAADVNPKEVGKGCTNSKYEVAYVGAANHHREYYSMFMNDPKCKIVPTPPFITEEEKKHIYSNSMIGLGLHHPPNLADKVVVERVYEVISFGAVCVSDHPSAPKATDGSAIYVRSKEEMMETVKKLINDKKLRAKIRARGFAYIRKDGTWAARAKQLINMANRLYNMGM